MNSSKGTHTQRIWLQVTKVSVAGLVYLLIGPLQATPPFGFTSQTFRGKITENLGTYQWTPSPLFTFLIQSSGDDWGFDVVQGTTEFGRRDAMGRPSESGWHDHPTALSIGLVIQGTVWSHATGTNCLRAFPTGSVFSERLGEIHNNYNLDPNIPAVVRIIHFVERGQAATRRDQPDPATGNTTASLPPPPVCLAGTPAGSHSHAAAHASSTAPGDQNSFSPPVPRAVRQRRLETEAAHTGRAPAKSE